VAIDPSTASGSAPSAWPSHQHQLRPDVARAVADTLGMSVQGLQSQLQSGQHLSDIAKAHGVSTQDLRTAIEAAREKTTEAAGAGSGGASVPVHHHHHQQADPTGGIDQQIGQQVLGAIADKLGESASDLTSQLAGGQDLGQLLQQKGLSTDDLRAAVQQVVQGFMPYGANGSTQAGAATPPLAQVDAVA